MGHSKKQIPFGNDKQKDNIATNKDNVAANKDNVAANKDNVAGDAVS